MSTIPRFMALMLLFSLIACGSSQDDDSQTDVTGGEISALEPTPPAPGGGEIDWAAQPLSLFSDDLHDIAMPEPGHVRVKLYGEWHEAEMLSDCSAPTEPSPPENDWDDHRFQAHFTVQMGERYSNLSVIRAVRLEFDGQARSGPVEMESVGLRTLTRGGQSVDLRTYSLRRNQPDQAPRVSRSHDERPQPPETADEVPGVRVHRDGRRATFSGLLGRGEATDDPDYQDSEEVLIAIHCGPV